LQGNSGFRGFGAKILRFSSPDLHNVTFISLRQFNINLLNFTVRLLCRFLRHSAPVLCQSATMLMKFVVFDIGALNFVSEYQAEKNELTVRRPWWPIYLKQHG
jgi:hypothetical protein